MAYGGENSLKKCPVYDIETFIKFALLSFVLLILTKSELVRIGAIVKNINTLDLLGGGFTFFTPEFIFWLFSIVFNSFYPLKK